MKEIKLTQGKVALVDDEDYEYLNQWKWYSHDNKNTFYARRNILIKNKRTSVKMHQLIANGKRVDHIDNDGLNNQKYNLRPCTQAQNTMNRVANKNSSSDFKGVSWNSKLHKWNTQIQINKIKIYIGHFNLEIEAAIAYNNKAIELFGEFAYLNKIPINT